MNATLSQQNKHHLQQMSYKGGINTKHPLTTLHENAEFNKMATREKTGEQVRKFEATPEMLAWFKGFKQTDQEKRECMPIVE